jgi:hypothetical protein
MWTVQIVRRSEIRTQKRNKHEWTGHHIPTKDVDPILSPNKRHGWWNHNNNNNNNIEEDDIVSIASSSIHHHQGKRNVYNANQMWWLISYHPPTPIWMVNLVPTMNPTHPSSDSDENDGVLPPPLLTFPCIHTIYIILWWVSYTRLSRYESQDC